MAGKTNTVSIIIPTYNEANIIGMTLKAYAGLSLNRKFSIIVVDDDSHDGTARIVREFSKTHPNVTLVVRKGQIGFGSALMHGSKIAKGDFIIWTMADGCDDTAAIPKMLAKLEQGYDVVVASRNIKGGKRGNQPILKSICSRGFCAVTKLFFGVNTSDPTNAFRTFRKSVLAKIELNATDFSISPEMILKAKRAGFKIGEVPVIYKERAEGLTKFKLLKMGKSYLKVLFRHATCR